MKTKVSENTISEPILLTVKSGVKAGPEIIVIRQL